MKAKKLPSGRWRAQVFLGRDENGKKITKSFTADTKSDAEFEAMMYKKEASRLTNDCTVAEAIDRYITNREAVLSPSTVYSYRQQQRDWYNDIGKLSVNSLTSEDVQKYVNKFSLDHSPKTTRNAYGLLRSSIIAANPDKAIHVQLPQKRIVKRKMPVDDQISTLMDNASHEMKIAIALAAMGTLRRGEICGLEYEDIKDNFIHVQRVVIKSPEKDYVTKDIPKTNSSDRWVELPPQVIELIGTGTGRIISLPPHKITNTFCRMRDRLGFDFRFHDLRHYAASIMHALGVPDEYIMERGGWSSDITLKSVYRDILEDKKNVFTEKTNDYMSKFF